MRDDELDELLAGADRQFQLAFHAESDHRINGLAAVVGSGRDEVRDSRTENPEPTIAEVPASLFTQIYVAWNLLQMEPAVNGDVLSLLAALDLGLEDQTLTREQALALVHDVIAEVSEPCHMPSREVVLAQLRVVELAIERLFDDADDRAGRAR